MTPAPRRTSWVALPSHLLTETDPCDHHGEGEARCEGCGPEGEEDREEEEDHEEEVSVSTFRALFDFKSTSASAIPPWRLLTPPNEQ